MGGPLGAATCGGITVCARDRGPRGKGGPGGLRHEPGLGGRDLGKRRGETGTHVCRAEQEPAGDGGHSEEWFEHEPKDAWSANKESWLTELVAPGRCGFLRDCENGAGRSSLVRDFQVSGNSRDTKGPFS